MRVAIERKLKRLNAIEPVIGHLKSDGRLARNFLIGVEGDAMNALLCGCRTQSMIDQTEKLKAGIQAKVEHPFRVIKHQFGFVKVRYHGLKKNTVQLVTLFALSNLWMVRSKLMGVQTCARPQTGQALCKGRKRLRSAVKPTEFLQLTREIP